MCQSATENLRLLLEFEQQGKSDIDACLHQHKGQFTELFARQAEANSLAAQSATEAKAKFAQQTDQLNNELRMNFNTFETDQSRIVDLVRLECANTLLNHFNFPYLPVLVDRWRSGCGVVFL